MTVTQIRNDKIYLTASVKVFTPSSDEIASFGFAQSVAQSAPNEKIIWLQGQYVEADTPNKNGQMWTQDELSIKSLTPKLMPVTIMHDFRTAVGVIADVKMRTPGLDGETSSSEPATIETVLAIWAHRFPEAAAEVMLNHDQGTLMQSMECEAPSFECSECSKLHIKPVERAEDLCEHLQRGEAARILRDVTFTGTGLIFGSRGAKGADPHAQLDTVRAEVAQWSDVKHGVDNDNERSTVDDITIKRSDYDALNSRPSADELATVSDEVANLRSEKDELAKQLEKAEVDLKGATEKLEAAETKISGMEEAAKADEMAKERLAEMPKELADKLPESITKRLAEQARCMNDDEWSDRVAELAELTKVKTDGDTAGETFGEAAMANFNGNGNVEGNSGNLSTSQIGAGLAKFLGNKE